MDKLYFPFHTDFTHFKKPFFAGGLSLFMALGVGNMATAQCVSPPAPVVIPNPEFRCIGGPPVRLMTGPAPYCSGPVNLAVPDNNAAGVNNTIIITGVPAACTIAAIGVTINMTHTRIGDMVFVLKAPNGQIINLDYRISATGNTASSTGFTNTIFLSTSTVPLSAAATPYTGSFKADAAIAAAGGLGLPGPTGMLPTSSTWPGLLTSSLNGAWTLGFYDAATGETGTLNSWCINFTYSCPLPLAGPGIWTPFTGLFYDAAATLVYTGLPVDAVYAVPLNSTTYSVTTQSSITAPIASFSNTNPITIPVGGAASAYPAQVTVSGLPISAVKVKSVVIHNFSHTNPGDVDILLQSPTNVNVMLMSDAGTGNTSNATYTFMDEAVVGMSAVNNNPGGTYKPTNIAFPDDFPAPGPGTFVQPSPALSNFSGNLNGTWKLFVIDDNGSLDQGAIAGGYTINFDTSHICISLPTLVTVSVGSPAAITTQPADQTICTDKVASFAVIATNGLTYQWQVSTNGGGTFTDISNTGMYSGASTAILTVTNPPVSVSGYRYRVLVNAGGACTAATSTAAILTVNPLPVVSFYAHPYHKLLPGLTTTLSSVVTPNAVNTYTWLHDGVPVTGGTADSLLVDFDHIGLYQLLVIDVNGCTARSDTFSVRDSALGRMFVYPNPSGGSFQVRLYAAPNAPTARAVILYNNMGLKIFSSSFSQNTAWQRIDVDAGKYGKGMYWVEIVDKEGKRISASRILIQ